jgi:hypothetical protein
MMRLSIKMGLLGLSLLTLAMLAVSRPRAPADKHADAIVAVPSEHVPEPENTSAQHIRTQDTNDDRSSASAQTTPTPRIPESAESAWSRIHLARDGASLLQAARSAPGPDASIALALLSGYCGSGRNDADHTYVEMRAYGITPNTERARLSVAAYKAFARQFCGGIAQEEIFAASAQNDAARTPEAEQMDRLRKASKEALRTPETAALIWDLIDNAASPTVALAAAETAAMAGTGRYAESNEALAGTRYGNRIEALRGEAAQHAFCIRTGACGPGTYLAAVQCQEYAFCTPGIPLGYFDVLQRVYSPYELQLIEQWSALLLANRPPVR